VRDRIELRCLSSNGGFAAGNNAAIGPALASAHPPDYIWLLNSDTVVHPGALQVLVSGLQSRPRAGLVGSCLVRTDGTIQRSAFRFPGIIGEWEANLQWHPLTRALAPWVIALPPPTVDTRVDWVSGACLLIRRAVLEQVGLLDESFFMTFEDVDYCRRSAAAGWETWYIPTSRVEHRVGGTSRQNSRLADRPRMPRYWFEARRRYFLKYKGFFYTLCADMSWLVGFGIRRIRQRLQRNPQTDPPRFWRDFFGYATGLSELSP
jgi:GT2 family glycosyltransferase